MSISHWGSSRIAPIQPITNAAASRAHPAGAARGSHPKTANTAAPSSRQAGVYTRAAQKMSAAAYSLPETITAETPMAPPKTASIRTVPRAVSPSPPRLHRTRLIGVASICSRNMWSSSDLSLSTDMIVNPVAIIAVIEMISPR